MAHKRNYDGAFSFSDKRSARGKEPDEEEEEEDEEQEEDSQYSGDGSEDSDFDEESLKKVVGFKDKKKQNDVDIKHRPKLGFGRPGFDRPLPQDPKKPTPFLPTEVWWRIFEFVDDLKSMKSLTRVSVWFYHNFLVYMDLRKQQIFKVMIGSYTPSAAQRAVVDVAATGKSIFLGGEAGTGKSATLNMIRIMLKSKGKRLTVTATTGAAAVLVEGDTIHRTVKVFDGSKTPEAYYRDGLKKGWDFVQDLDAIVVDEVSMMGASLMDLVDSLLRLVKAEPNKPFGGIQMIFVGDFKQLPPIKTVRDPETGRETRVKEYFAYRSRAWGELFGPPFPEEPNGGTILPPSLFSGPSSFAKPAHTTTLFDGGSSTTRPLNKEDYPGRMFNLRINFRQSSTDEGFKMLCNNLMNGVLSEDSERLLQSRIHTASEIQEKIDRGEIHPIRVMSTNREVESENRTMFNSLKGAIVKYDAECVGDMNEFPKSDVPQAVLCLKVGTEFVVVKNHVDPEGVRHYNGKRGRVVGFANNKAKTEAEKENKVQGFGKLPLVIYHDEGKNGKEPPVRKLYPFMFQQFRTDKKTGKEQVVATKYQLPVVHGWAITIHKAQGMTLAEIVTNLATVFAEGQAYVAVSRLRSLSGLYLLDYDKRRITASTEAYKFYETHFPTRVRKNTGKPPAKRPRISFSSLPSFSPSSSSKK